MEKYNENKKISEYRRQISNTQAIEEDCNLDNIISDDMQTISHEVGGQDGLYNNFPISRVYRDSDTIRVYALDSSGGVAIIHTEKKRFQILTLGEDDGFHFLNSRRIYEQYHGNKRGFVSLLSEALSLFNNIKI